jgi:hypothetical protein
MGETRRLRTLAPSLRTGRFDPRAVIAAQPAMQTLAITKPRASATGQPVIGRSEPHTTPPNTDTGAPNATAMAAIASLTQSRNMAATWDYQRSRQFLTEDCVHMDVNEIRKVVSTIKWGKDRIMGLRTEPLRDHKFFSLFPTR